MKECRRIAYILTIRFEESAKVGRNMADLRGLALFVIRRLIYLLVTIILIISIAFYAFRIGSGDPMMLYTPRDLNVSGELYEEVVDNLHLDDSLSVQYVHYVYERLTGDFDYPSWAFSGRTVTYVDEFVYDGMLKTLFLLTMVIGSSVLIGTAYGMLAAMPRRLSILDALVSLPILVLFCMPAVCTILMAMDLNWRLDGPFPLGGPYGTDYESLTPYEKVIDILNHAFLPVLVGFLATVGFFALIVRTGIRRSLMRPENLAAEGMRIREQHLLVNAFHCTLPLVKLFVVASLTVALIIDYLFGYRGLGYMLFTAVWYMDWPAFDVIFYLTALVAIVFMFAFEFPVILAHWRLEKRDGGREVAEPSLPDPVGARHDLRDNVVLGLTRNWRFVLGLSGLLFVVLLAAIGPSIAGVDPYSRSWMTAHDLTAYEYFLAGARVPLYEIALFSVLSGGIGLVLGALTAIASSRTRLLGRLTNRGLEILSDGMIAVPLISLCAVVAMTRMTFLDWGIPLVAFLWFLGPVANTAKGPIRSGPLDGGGPPGRHRREFWCGVASRTLFATKYVAVIGLLTTVFIEFALGRADIYSWARMIEVALDYGLIATHEGWLWTLLSGLGYALLAASVYVVIGEFERVFKNLSKT